MTEFVCSNQSRVESAAVDRRSDSFRAHFLSAAEIPGVSQTLHRRGRLQVAGLPLGVEAGEQGATRCDDRGEHHEGVLHCPTTTSAERSKSMTRAATSRTSAAVTAEISSE